MAKTRAEALLRPIKHHDPEETSGYVPDKEVCDMVVKYLNFSMGKTRCKATFLENNNNKINKNGMRMQRELISRAFPGMDNATKRRALNTVRFIDKQLGEANE